MKGKKYIFGVSLTFLLILIIVQEVIKINSTSIRTNSYQFMTQARVIPPEDFFEFSQKFTLKEKARDDSTKLKTTRPEKGTIKKSYKMEDKSGYKALAIHFVTLVYEEPSFTSEILGYLRRGTIVKVRPTNKKGDCKEGWYEVVPYGYVCKGRGVIVKGENENLSFEDAPPPPNFNSSLPYTYGYIVYDFVPEFYNKPSKDELKKVEAYITELKKKYAKGKREDSQEKEAFIKADPSPQEVEKEEEKKHPYSVLHQILSRGFYISIDKVDDKYVKTIRGRYVPKDYIIYREPPDFRGVILNESSNPLPFIFTKVKGSKKLSPYFTTTKDIKMHIAEELRLHQIFPFVGILRLPKGEYVSIGNSYVINRRSSSIIKFHLPPQSIPKNSKWIDVDLTEQTLVAYEGTKPVFATLVSTGREKDNFPTPEGIFTIQSKHISVTMDDPNGGEEAYSIEDVPWTMFFYQSFALHGAFWHNGFGRERSHGCVNLSPHDAKWLFFWTDPQLPSGWHGIYVKKDKPTTYIVIHK